MSGKILHLLDLMSTNFLRYFLSQAFRQLFILLEDLQLSNLYAKIKFELKTWNLVFKLNIFLSKTVIKY